MKLLKISKIRGKWEFQILDLFLIIVQTRLFPPKTSAEYPIRNYPQLWQCCLKVLPLSDNLLHNTKNR